MGVYNVFQVSRDDYLPKLICSVCLLKLHDAFEFKKLVITSDLCLRENTQFQEGKKYFFIFV